MAMFPNATNGYMPFVSGQNVKKGVPAKKHGKSVKGDKRRKGIKTYQVTLRDRSGKTYTYIVRSDATKSMPVLCNTLANNIGCTTSLPNLGLTSPVKKMLYSRDDLDCKDDRDNDKKEGIFSAFFRFLREKTGKSKGGKSKRKPKPQLQRKRQRTISAMSNLDPIQESPDEDDYIDEDDDEDVDDNDSYTHESSSLSSESEPNSENVSICETDSKKESEENTEEP
ncbi:hypothetical protein FSP39_014661 [Pinctada imbricata]|uniref:Uncharacterized protein n=1 Tax=Pinctada imbricata TaxID=66713 RepID=A0AA88YTJ8_PINIB|nr:hypothetical protein FSP39_014661 [Pinctada imbricata]